MSLFSEREGIKPARSIIQINSMDDALKSGLWNALDVLYWHKVKPSYEGHLLHPNKDMYALFTRLWDSYFKKPIDTMPDYWPDTREGVRDYFFSCKWYEVYDFIEFIASAYIDDSVNKQFMDTCNFILERELSAYRFVGGKIARITSEIEITEIEEAIESTDSLKSVNSHLRLALDLLADRKSPDYRNSVKESISAVEGICGLMSGEPKTTLGQALKEIEKQSRVELHPALKKAFDSLYGYTSDAEGIRHALLAEPNLDFEDAKFMLVACSAFINYLKIKSSKAGMKL